MRAVIKKIFNSVLITLLTQSNAFAQNFWEYISLVPTSVNCMTINSYDYIFAGGFPNGYYRSTDNGVNWISLPLYARYPSCVEINSSNTIFVGQIRGVFRSEDNGESWIEINNGLTDFRALNIAFSSNNTVFLGTQGSGVFRSTNNGDKWDQINNGITNLDIDCILVSQNDHIFIGTTSSGVFRSTNNGDEWNQINNGLLNWNIKCFGVNDNGDLFLGTNGGGVYRSSNGGDNWIVINNGLTSLLINDIALNSLDHLFIGTQEEGVFRSSDNGNSWIQINSGFDSSDYLEIKELKLNSEDYIFAVRTNGRFYRSVNITTSLENEHDKIPTGISLTQNFPNPFNPSTVITYQLPIISYVTLTVYDILGNEVARIVSEEKPAGSHDVEFDGSDLTSGIYFYQFKAGDYSETKKMILLK